MNQKKAKLKNHQIASENRVIMFIDIVGYTPKTASLGREKFNELHDIFDSLSYSIFNKFNGEVINKMGDAFLVLFRASTNAILCGVELQKCFDEYGRKNKNQLLKIRVAIHSGEVIFREGGVFGDAVNAAARIEGVAKAEEVVFSEAVFLTMNKNEVPLKYMGQFKLKGLKHPIKLFKVKTRKDITAERMKKLKRMANYTKQIILKIIVITIVLLLLWLGIKSFLLV